LFLLSFRFKQEAVSVYKFLLTFTMTSLFACKLFHEYICVLAEKNNKNYTEFLRKRGMGASWQWSSRQTCGR